MAAPLDAPWAGLVVSAASLDKTTYGQGTTFPSPWPVDRLFWRSDRKRMYYNKGTEGSPTWEGADVLVGTITMYGGKEADVKPGWLLCDGQAVSRTTFAELFDRLGTEYGVGDGSTTFNVPDMQTSNKFPRGAANDAGRGDTGGESTHALTTTELASHSHGITDPGHNHGLTGGNSAGSGGTCNASCSAGAYSTGSKVTGITINNAGSGTAHENKPPFLDCHFIIAV